MLKKTIAERKLQRSSTALYLKSDNIAIMKEHLRCIFTKRERERARKGDEIAAR